MTNRKLHIDVDQSQLVADCPRCGAKTIGFTVQSALHVGNQHGWQRWWEAFCECHHCRRSTVFLLSEQHSSTNEIIHDGRDLCRQKGAINDIVDVVRFISLIDADPSKAPAAIPDDVERAFKEGATCLRVQCWNAAATMFRLAVDLTTRPMLPDQGDGLNDKVRRDLGLRLPWLFSNGYIPKDLQDLSTCVQQDGNDGAHRGTLTKHDAEDLLDFATALLERIFTEPARLKSAAERRKERRTQQ